jgi:hypothetical protein
MTVEILISLLQLIDQDENVDINNKRHVHPLVEAVVYLATEYLAIENNYRNIQLLKNAGYKVFPGEQDSFGWLTGWIEIKKGQILFG